MGPVIRLRLLSLSASLLVIPLLQACDDKETPEGAVGPVRYARVFAVGDSQIHAFFGSSQAVLEQETTDVTAGPLGAAMVSGQLEVTVLVPRSLVPYIAVDRQARVAFDRLTDGSYRIVGREEPGRKRERVTLGATVEEVDSYRSADGSMSTVTVRFQPQDRMMRPGMAAEVKLEVGGSSAGRLVVLPEAVREDADGHYVFVLRDDGPGRARLSYRPITVAAIDGRGAEIIDGLSDGELVVIAELESIRDGLSVPLGSSAVTRS